MPAQSNFSMCPAYGLVLFFSPGDAAAPICIVEGHSDAIITGNQIGSPRQLFKRPSVAV